VELNAPEMPRGSARRSLRRAATPASHRAARLARGMRLSAAHVQNLAGRAMRTRPRDSTAMDDQRRKMPVTTAEIASGTRERETRPDDSTRARDQRGQVGEPRDHRYEPGEERDRRFQRPDAGEPGAMRRDRSMLDRLLSV
jgi:hypothetical protein